MGGTLWTDRGHNIFTNHKSQSIDRSVCLSRYPCYPICLFLHRHGIEVAQRVFTRTTTGEGNFKVRRPTTTTVHRTTRTTTTRTTTAVAQPTARGWYIKLQTTTKKKNQSGTIGGRLVFVISLYRIRADPARQNARRLDDWTIVLLSTYSQYRSLKDTCVAATS